MASDKVMGVYKFTNKLSGRVYIGGSPHVWYDYVKHIKGFYHGKDMSFPKKYFNFEILIECPDEKSTLLWQTYYIIKYDAGDKDKGYNGKAAPVKYSIFVKNMINGYFGEIFDRITLNRVTWTT